MTLTPLLPYWLKRCFFFIYTIVVDCDVDYICTKHLVYIMNKKTVVRKGRPCNRYSLGSWMKGANETLGKSDLVGALGGIGGLGGLANATASAVGGLINPSGNSTGVGNAMQSAGSALSNIPGVGGLIGAGVNMLGGVVNAGFGSNINENFVNQTQDAVRRQAASVSNASDTSSLLNDWGSHSDLANVSKGDVGSEGWFSNKATNKARELNRQIAEANMKAWQSLSNTAANVDANNDMLMAANFSAMGGPLTHGGVFDNGLTVIDNGGSHESNPFEGVQMGVDNEGVPNLVEEGEVVFNDYVFSDRLKVPKDVKRKYRLKGDTFAKAAKSAGKESEERPNDPISKNGLRAMLGILAESQEIERMKDSDMGMSGYANGGRLSNKFVDGGDKSTDLDRKLNIYNNFTKLTDDSFYTPEYMRFWNWYRDNYDTDKGRSLLDRINSGEFGQIGGNTFRPEDILRLAHDYKKGPVHNAFAKAAGQYAIDSMLPDLGDVEDPDLLEGVDAGLDNDLKDFKEWLRTPDIDVQPAVSHGRGIRQHPLRYAPIVGSGIAVLNDMLGGNEPDYSNADLFARSIRDANRPIGTRPIGNYLPYEPLDRMFYVNQLNRNAASERRAALNNAGGNRAAALAGILSADYNYGNSLGDVARQAEEYNQNLRRNVADFNRQTDMFNSEQGVKVDMFNSELGGRQASMYGNLANMRQNILDANRAEKSANLTNFIQGLGDLGRELTDRDTLRWLAEDTGAIVYNPKGKYTGYRYSAAPKKQACGGRIKRKRRYTV